ncbi:hypothetical protein ACFYPG_21050 [Micromonospora sp. NPDC005553]|uniref:hypothetical protein n=1 Tax=Micromonospora sp. NPDC005553 TaxID=3364232 RepID=UPI0036990861
MEIIKLVVAALTPLSVALIGVMLTLSTRRFERSHWLNQKLVEKRIQLLSEALPRLNDLYSYFYFVGDWAVFSPSTMLRNKRELDRLFYGYQAFFTSTAVAEYKNFMDTLFTTYVAPESDARLRTSNSSRHGTRSNVYPGKWEAAWDLMFVDEADQSDFDLIKERYHKLLSCLGSEVGITTSEKSKK